MFVIFQLLRSNLPKHLDEVLISPNRLTESIRAKHPVKMVISEIQLLQELLL